MARDPADGPHSEYARYAFGWSDKKPGIIFWLIVAGMFAYVVYRFTILGGTL